MNFSENNARIALLGADPAAVPWTGAGARVMLLDSGMGVAPDFGGRLVNLASLQGVEARSLAGNAHGLRNASICAEGPEAAGLPGGPLGIAPRATLFSGVYMPLLPDGFKAFLKSVVGRYGRIDVIGAPWSVPETHRLAHHGRAGFAQIADGDPDISALVVAAAGHDGTKGVRFPAACESVLAVGVCDAEGRPTHYCGVDAAARKPELLVPEQNFLARLETGELGQIGGTSAAVAVVTGLAALWCERLRAADINPTPAMLRAALLATSSSSAAGPFRVVNAAALLEGARFSAFHWPGGAPRRSTLVSERGGPVRVAVSACAPARPRLWMPRLPELRLEVRGPGVRVESTGSHRCVLQFEAEAQERYELTVCVEGSVQSLAVFAADASLSPAPARAPSGATRGRPRNVIGVSASHNASACLLQDGRLRAAVQLERVTRKKRDGVGYLRSREAIDYCLHAAGLTPDDVDLFAFNAQPLLPGWVGLSQPSHDEDFDVFDPFGARSLFVSHHLAHAFSAFFGSPFETAAVFVADGSGGSTLGPKDLLLPGPEFEQYLRIENGFRPRVHVQSTYVFRPDGFELIDREEAESFNVRCGSSSIGEVYAAVSQYIFGDWQEGGKLMGLAPYGDAAACGDSFLVRDERGRLQFSATWKNRFRQNAKPKQPMELRDLAARVQKDLEECLIERVRRAVELTGQRRLAYAGGIGLNSVANERIWRETPVEEFFVLPASNDAGIAIGAAAAGDFHLTKSTGRPRQPYSDFLGYEYTEADYELAIREYRAHLERAELDLGDLAEQLAAGRIVAWFEGASEFGPRALGHRSILADPRAESTWHRLNAEVKFREDFRPLAPIVPAEVAAEYFEIDEPSPYMLRVVKVKEEYRKKLGAVCHVDGSARVQTVERAALPRIHELLHLMKQRIGLPVLVNTSLNVRGQAMLETPLQAVELLLTTRIDALVLGRNVLTPKRHGAGLGAGHVISLPATTRVICESSPEGPVAVLTSALRGETRYNLQRWCFDMLADADGRATVGELFARHLPAGVSAVAALSYLTALHRGKLILAAEPGAQA